MGRNRPSSITATDSNWLRRFSPSYVLPEFKSGSWVGPNTKIFLRTSITSHWYLRRILRNFSITTYSEAPGYSHLRSCSTLTLSRILPFEFFHANSTFIRSSVVWLKGPNFGRWSPGWSCLWKNSHGIAITPFTMETDQLWNGLGSDKEPYNSMGLLSQASEFIRAFTSPIVFPSKCLRGPDRIVENQNWKNSYLS